MPTIKEIKDLHKLVIHSSKNLSSYSDELKETRWINKLSDLKLEKICKNCFPKWSKIK